MTIGPVNRSIIAASDLLLLGRLLLKARSNQTPIAASSTISLVEALSKKTLWFFGCSSCQTYSLTVHVKLAEAAVTANGPIRMDLESRA